MREVLISMISSIVGAVLSAIITAVITTRNQKRKDIIERNKKTYENRPEFTVIDYKNYISRIGYGLKLESDINVFLTQIMDVNISNIVEAIYKEESFDKEKWCCVIYTLKNVGKTDIKVTDLICNNKQYVSLIESDISENYLKNKMLNYSVTYDKKIRVGDEIKIKICFHNNYVISNPMCATLEIGMEDDNSVYWKQPLFVPENKIYKSYKVSGREYINSLNTYDAEECFKKPWLW